MILVRFPAIVLGSLYMYHWVSDLQLPSILITMTTEEQGNLLLEMVMAAAQGDGGSALIVLALLIFVLA